MVEVFVPYEAYCEITARPRCARAVGTRMRMEFWFHLEEERHLVKCYLKFSGSEENEEWVGCFRENDALLYRERIDAHGHRQRLLSTHDNMIDLCLVEYPELIGRRVGDDKENSGLVFGENVSGCLRTAWGNWRIAHVYRRPDAVCANEISSLQETG